MLPKSIMLRKSVMLHKPSIIIPRRLSPLLFAVCFMLWIGCGVCAAIPKPHVITFGKWISAKWPNATGEKMLDLKVRALLVDTRLKEYTTGSPHEQIGRAHV